MDDDIAEFKFEDGMTILVMPRRGGVHSLAGFACHCMCLGLPVPIDVNYEACEQRQDRVRLLASWNYRLAVAHMKDRHLLPNRY